MFWYFGLKGLEIYFMIISENFTFYNQNLNPSQLGQYNTLTTSLQKDKTY